MLVGSRLLVLAALVSTIRSEDPLTDLRIETVAGRRIFEMGSYRDGQIFRFDVPLDTKMATWFFRTNHTEGCEPGTVSVHLQPGGYPIVVPDGGAFPDSMRLLPTFRDANNLTFNPRNGEHFITVNSPEPGHWFMLAYINKKRQRDFLEQPLDGSAPSGQKCLTWLTTRAEYQIESHIIQLFPEKHNHQKLLLYHNIDKPQTYRFFTGKNVWSARVNLTRCRLKPSAIDNRQRSWNGCPLRISAAANKPPDIRDRRTTTAECREGGGDACSLVLSPDENAWHFIKLTPTSSQLVEFAITVAIEDCPLPTEKVTYLLANRVDPHQICSGITKNARSAIQLLFPPYQQTAMQEPQKKCGKRIQLARKTLPGVFQFEYQLPALKNQSSPPLTLTLDNDVPSVLQFPIGITDIGGSMAVELGVNNGQLSGDDAETITLLACLTHGQRVIPNTDPTAADPRAEKLDPCPGGHLLNLTLSAGERVPRFDRIVVPYPVVGEWFVTLVPKCRREAPERRGPAASDMLLYSSSGHVPCSSNTTPIVFSIYSDMCVMGSCGKYGRCYQFFSGGNMFSTCTCFAGYKGWGCTDSSDATSEIDLLAATLLLCLSNLIFLPAVGLAIYRGFYTESFIYFANMVFSTLYHACDQDVFSFCLMKYSVLQFCDYYTATMSYWVTVLAIGGLPDQAKSLLHMVGAVGVALAIEYDRTGVFTFLVPGAIGIIIMIASWITHCSSDHSCYPGFKYTCCFFLPGLCVACGGVFAFVFLEQESNYQFVHSAWHVSMAVAILFMLPRTPSDEDEKYTFLEATPFPPPGESSFKHYVDPENAPEVMNCITSSAGNTVLPPDQVLDTSLRNAHSVGTLNRSNGTRSAMAAYSDGRPHAATLGRRPATAYGGEPSTDTLRRVRFEKTGGTPEESTDGATAVEVAEDKGAHSE